MKKFSNAIETVIIILAWLILAAEAGSAEGSANQQGACQGSWPNAFPTHRAFLLNDPRSGLMLLLESDGRHMVAITRAGRIVWQRNLFDDPKLLRSLAPPPTLPGEKPMSDDEWRQWVLSFWDRQYIDRLGVVPDCETQIIDHQYRVKLLRGHYVRAGSGTQIYYLLDAKTGDFAVEAVN